MTIAIRVTVDDKDVSALLKRIPESVPKEINNTVFKYTVNLSKLLRRAAVDDPLRPITNARKSAAMRINARKMGKNKSAIVMPSSLVFLDTMRPHYVSLKRGRNVTRWARKNYGTATVSGKSRVLRGPRGGITGGFLYVTPHHFVQRTLAQERNKLPNELRRGVRKAIKAKAF